MKPDYRTPLFTCPTSRFIANTSLIEVGKVAAGAGARRLVLTHLMERGDVLPDEPWIKAASAGFDGEVIVGHDLLEVGL